MMRASGTDFVLFVAGEPGTGEEPGWRYVGFLDGSVRQRAARRPPDDVPPRGVTGEEPWHFPAETIKHINVVLEVASHEGRSVTVVDVNRSGPYADLVRQSFQPTDLLPLLLRPDGSRLEGAENFVPRVLRRFMSGR